jgi:hypothetical protein
MSKYNHIKSIPVDSIPKEELAQAIREWAEGDEAMERLLWACYEKGIKTNGCHAGAFPYIGLDYSESSRDKLAQIMGAVLSVKGSQVMAKADGGNPFSGPDWYKPNLGVGFNTEYQDVADPLFDMLTETIEGKRETDKDMPVTPLTELLDFLVGKYTNLLIRIKHTEEDEYIFSLERAIHQEYEEAFREFDELFTSSGLTLQENDTPLKSWEVKSDDPAEFIVKVAQVVENIMTNYSFKKPETKEEAAGSFTIAAHLKRDECGDDEKEFELWLMTEREKMDREAEEARKARDTEKQKEL